MDDVLAELQAASVALKRLDQRRVEQQRYRDDLIGKARAAGVGWAAIRGATGMQDRSLALALRRITPDEKVTMCQPHQPCATEGFSG